MRIKKHNTHKLAIIGVAEGAVFGLLGLLVAFTFAGAYDRFEARKKLIIEEANAIYTAYLRLELLPPQPRKILQRDFQQYMDMRLNIYKDLTLANFPLINERARELRKLQRKIWSEVITLKTKNDDSFNSTIDFLLSALNSMFEDSNAQFAMSKVHPPVVIFGLLMVLALLSAFLTGYSSARKGKSNYLYILSYVLVTAITLYVIFDLEMPRLGLIRVTSFDHEIMQKIGELTQKE